MPSLANPCALGKVVFAQLLEDHIIDFRDVGHGCEEEETVVESWMRSGWR
jgi:hypothetical protein